jgi:phosphonopyruvate decarboxylase
MIAPSSLCAVLGDHGLDRYYGVPDSTLKHFCSYLTDTLPPSGHTICVNEGLAVASAIGYHLATSRAAVVYMQNSGLGNAVNPLTSLVHKEVYSIPMLLMIGWRGMPGVKDEPQHVFMGRVTKTLLDALEIPYAVLDGRSDVAGEVAKAVAYMAGHGSPYALLVEKGTFEPHAARAVPGPEYAMSREDAVTAVADSLENGDLIVSTTGMASRELFEKRKACGQPHGTDFLTVGGMGCASSIALGVALNAPEKRVACIDGDGALLMHMGGLASLGKAAPSNCLHVVVNNGIHGSTGGQPNLSRHVDVCAVARACGYPQALRAETPEDLEAALSAGKGRLTMIEVMTNDSVRKDLGRPTNAPLENKRLFMDSL